MLDELLPDYDVREVHSTTTAAAPEAIVTAIGELTPTEVPLLVALMTLRAACRSFRRYWRLIYPGSAAIRMAWLRAIRRRAERAGFAASARLGRAQAD